MVGRFCETPDPEPVLHLSAVIPRRGAALLLRRTRSRDPLRDISLALLLGGIMGNLTDRFLHGHVIDFALFDLHVPFAHPWPAFNVADSCICIAVFFFIIHSFRSEKKTPAA